MKALANSTYEESLAYMKRNESNTALPNSMSSLDRFVRAGVMAKKYKPDAAKSAIDYAFDILRNVAQGAHTQWSIVYDVRNLAVHFFTNYQTHTGQRAGGNCQASGDEFVSTLNRKLSKG